MEPKCFTKIMPTTLRLKLKLKFKTEKHACNSFSSVENLTLYEPTTNKISDCNGYRKQKS